MARLRPAPEVRELSYEEVKRVADFFLLLMEIDRQKGITLKRRSPNAGKRNHDKKLPKPFLGKGSSGL